MLSGYCLRVEASGIDLIALSVSIIEVEAKKGKCQLKQPI